MAFNRFETVQPTEFKLPQTNLEVLAGVLNAKQKRFDESVDQYDDINNQYIDAYKTDRATANTIQNQWQTKADEIVNNYQGDYSRAYRELKGLRKNITKDMSPGGKAHAIIMNNKAINEALVDARDRYSKGLISAEDLKIQQDAIDRQYAQGIGEMDPLTGNYNIANPERIQNAVSANEIGFNAVKALVPEGSSVTKDRISGKWIVTTGDQVSELTQDRIYDEVSGRLLNDDNYMSAITQRGRMMGLEGTELQQYVLTRIDDAAKSFAPHAYKKTAEVYSLKPNQVKLHEISEANKDARSKAAISAYNNFKYDKRQLDYSPNKNRTIKVGDISRAVGKETNKASLDANPLTYSALNTLKELFPGVVGRYNLLSNEKEGINSIQKLVDSGEFENIGGQVPLMQKLIDYNRSSGNEITGEELLKQYNEVMEAGGAGATNTGAGVVLDGDTGKRVGDSLFEGQLFNYADIEVDGVPYTPEQFRTTYLTDMKNKNGTLRPEYQNTILTDATLGIPPRFIYNVDGKTVTVSAPPAVQKAMEPVTQLAQSRYNSNGISPTVENLNYQFNTLDEDGNVKTVSLYGKKVRMLNQWEGSTLKDINEKEFLEYVDPETNQWTPVKGITANGEQRDISINDINKRYLDAVLKANFATQNMTATGKPTIEFSDNEFLGGLYDQNQ